MKFARSISLILVLTTLSACAVFAQSTAATSKQTTHTSAEKNFFVYLGTFIGSTPGGHPDGNPQSKGVYMARFDAETGALSTPVLAAEVDNPTFLTISPSQRFLYVITERDPEAFVSA